MYEVPFAVVRNGMQSGYRCPISDALFTAFDASSSQMDALRLQQREHTARLMARLDRGNVPAKSKEPGAFNPARTVESYRAQYLAEQANQV
jgi:hypothetical protein